MDRRKDLIAERARSAIAERVQGTIASRGRRADAERHRRIVREIGIPCRVRLRRGDFKRPPGDELMDVTS
jgi:hypothetical protein